MKIKWLIISILFLLFFACDSKKKKPSEQAEPTKIELSKNNKKATKQKSKVGKNTKKAGKYWTQLQKETGITSEQRVAFAELNAKYQSQINNLKNEGKWEGDANKKNREEIVEKRRLEQMDLLGKKKYRLKREFDKKWKGPRS